MIMKKKYSITKLLQLWDKLVSLIDVKQRTCIRVKTSIIDFTDNNMLLTQVWIGLLAQLTFSNLYDSYMWLGNRYIIYIFIPFWSHHTTSLYIFVNEVFSTWRWCSVAFEIWCFLCNYRCFSYIFSFHRIFCFVYIGESV